MRKSELQEFPPEWWEMLDSRDWRRYLSPVDDEWTWQDSPSVTALRELVRSIATRPRADGVYPPPYEERAATRGQLTVLQSLDAAKALTRMLETEIEQLVIELRAREVSWEVISMALGCRRQTAHTKYDSVVRHESLRWASRFIYELDAARRVAMEVTQSADVTVEEREEAHDFLDRSDFNTQKRTTNSLKRKHR